MPQLRPEYSDTGPMSATLTRRVRVGLAAHLVLATTIIVLQAGNDGAWSVTWVFTWLGIVVAPAIGVELGLRALARPQLTRAEVSRLLASPIIVSWLAIITLVEVLTTVHRR